MSTQEIYHYIKINDHLITGGQPTAEQLQAAAAEGFEVVINLATERSTPTLKDEAEVVRALGMAYYPIPVEWEQPKESDFWAFEAVMRQVGKRKTLLHCAANFRVTAFYSLYAQKNLGWTEAQAEAFRAPIWQGSNDPVWENFIAEMRKKLNR